MLAPLGRRMAAFLSKEGHVHSTSQPTSQKLLKRALRPADVLLVEGTSIIATAIKYLTQSTWSHAALCIGDATQGTGESEHEPMFVEADLMDGVRRVGLPRYAGHHCRICRPVGLSPGDVKHVLSQAIGQLGRAYDTRNIIDLARYLFPTPPVPASWRREMIAFGSGDPTRAICSGTHCPVVRSGRVSGPARRYIPPGAACRLSRLRRADHARAPSQSLCSARLRRVALL